MACSESGVMLAAEIAEGKEADAKKEYRDRLG
jgi:hypothetical protein